MNIPSDYVPSVRWRMGEYQALSRLSDQAKARITPFVIIPEIEFDFDEWAPKKTVQEHVEPFTKRFKQKWGKRPAWIDVHPKICAKRMDNGKLPVTYVFDELSIVGSNAVPVISLDSPPAITAAVAATAKRDMRGVGIRVTIEDIMQPQCKGDMDTLIEGMGVNPMDADLIVDLGAPNFEPYSDFAAGLIAAMSSFGDLSVFRSYVVMGTAFPPTDGLDQPGGDLPRHDWLFFKALVSELDAGGRIPTYGDYTVVHPEFTPRDMRLIKSVGKVVYTQPESWHVRKGGAFRDNPAQMHDHCRYILESGKFRGATFSDGDAYIERCANKEVGPSNQPFWKQVAISHHVMHVLEDLSKFSARA